MADDLEGLSAPAPATHFYYAVVNSATGQQSAVLCAKRDALAFHSKWFADILSNPSVDLKDNSEDHPFLINSKKTVAGEGYYEHYHFQYCTYEDMKLFTDILNAMDDDYSKVTVDENGNRIKDQPNADSSESVDMTQIIGEPYRNIIHQYATEHWQSLPEHVRAFCLSVETDDEFKSVPAPNQTKYQPVNAIEVSKRIADLKAGEAKLNDEQKIDLETLQFQLRDLKLKAKHRATHQKMKVFFPAMYTIHAYLGATIISRMLHLYTAGEILWHTNMEEITQESREPWFDYEVKEEEKQIEQCYAEVVKPILAEQESRIPADKLKLIKRIQETSIKEPDGTLSLDTEVLWNEFGIKVPSKAEIKEIERKVEEQAREAVAKAEAMAHEADQKANEASSAVQAAGAVTTMTPSTNQTNDANDDDEDDDADEDAEDDDDADENAEDDA